MQVWSMGGEDPLDKEMATQSSVLAWLGDWESMKLQRVGHGLETKQQQQLNYFKVVFARENYDWQQFITGIQVC